MKPGILTTFFAFLVLQSFCQTPVSKNTYLKFSGGRVSFGTGDFLGYSFGFDVSKNVIKRSRWGLDKLLLGGEFIVENGVKNPVIQHATLDQFLAKTFRHTSNALVWTKASYYPFKKILRGFNIQAGPTFGYAHRSTELQAKRVVDAIGNPVRQSMLLFDNGFTAGYRISTGVEFDITRKFLAGFRLDFSNNNEAEINTLAGLKIGVML